MNYKKLFGYGALIWVIAYFVAMILVVLKVNYIFWAEILVGLAAVLAAAFFGSKLSKTSAVSILKYSVGWVIIGLILDLVFTIPFTGWAIFTDWSYVSSYVLIAIIPVFTAKKS